MQGILCSRNGSLPELNSGVNGLRTQKNASLYIVRETIHAIV